MKLFIAITVAAIYGLTIRFLYGLMGNVMPIMSISFFFLAPFSIGYLTTFLIPYRQNQTATAAFFKPALTCLAIMAVTMALNMEGDVCWFMAFPLFVIIAGMGGLIAFNRKKRRAIGQEQWDFDKDDWNKPGALKVSFLLLTPLLAGLIEGDRMSGYEAITVGRHIDLPAPPGLVWNTLMKKERPSAAGSHHFSIVGLLGFPHHLSTTLDQPVVGGSRIARYEKGLTFMETITRIEPQRSLTLKITNDPSTISKAIMDEHIVIGGRHIKMLEDQYQLTPLSNGKTELTLSSQFCINTPFNWYAGLWAKWLMSDIIGEELQGLQQADEAP